MGAELILLGDRVVSAIVVASHGGSSSVIFFPGFRGIVTPHFAYRFSTSPRDDEWLPFCVRIVSLVSIRSVAPREPRVETTTTTTTTTTPCSPV